jgi:hypothetical protein
LSGDIQWLLESVPILDQLPDLLWSVTQPLVTSSGFGMLYNLTAARWQANHRSLEPLQQLASKRDLPADRLDPPPLITGDDLRQLGWSPGPKFRQTLREIRAAQLDGEISSRNDAIHRAQDIQRNSQMNAPDEDPNG